MTVAVAVAVVVVVGVGGGQSCCVVGRRSHGLESLGIGVIGVNRKKDGPLYT